MKKSFKKILIFFCISLFFVGSVKFSLAENLNKDIMFGGDRTGGASSINEEMGGLTEADPRILIARIINIIFGFLGIIAVVLTIYAGWMWMSSQGDTQKIEKAKKLLKATVIGLAIILASFAIVNFILGAFMDIGGTGTGDPECVDGVSRGCGSCGGTQLCINGSWSDCVDFCGSDPFPDQFVVTSTNPEDGSTNNIRNVLLVVYLNKTIDGDVSTNNFYVNKIGTVDPNSGNVTPSGPSPVSGDLTTTNNMISFKSDGDCGVPGVDGCLDAWGQYEVTVVDIMSGTDPSRELTPNPTTFEFSTNDSMDIDSPIAHIIPMQMCSEVAGNPLPESANNVGAWGNDDTGFQRYDFFQNGVGESFSVDTPPNTLVNYRYPPNTLVQGDSYIFSVNFVDYSGKEDSDEFEATVRPGHCCNNELDENLGEEDVDCGGECDPCLGMACNIDSPNTCGMNKDNCDDLRCASLFCGCGNGSCICEDKPIISSISPIGGFCDNNINQACKTDQDCVDSACNMLSPNGAPGNFVSIAGLYFGDDAGTVEFSNGSGGWVVADLANEANPDCPASEVWKPNQIIAVVPDGAATGPVKVTDRVDHYEIPGNYFSDTTDDIPDEDDIRGPDIEFIVNSIVRPGLCAIDPDSGVLGDPLSYIGTNLSGAKAYFGNIANPSIAGGANTFNNLSGNANVPNIVEGYASTFALKQDTGGIDIASNYLTFLKDAEPIPGPEIIRFEPISGNKGQYVTIYGNGFGSAQGISEVWFDPTSGGESIEADFNFPTICAGNLWDDGQIIIKVPDLGNGQYYLRIVIGGQFEDDSSDIIFNANIPSSPTFEFSNGMDLPPSLCKIAPSMGSNNSNVKLFGEYFGSSLTGHVEFHDGKQAGSSLWQQNGDFDEIVTTVPQDAIDGPVKVVQSEAGNGLNFKIGNCTNNEDCGGTICCGEDSFRPGVCASDDVDLGGNNDGEIDIYDCYLPLSSSVFEFEFTTTDREIDCSSQNMFACGNVCCATDVCVDGACATCEIDEFLCGDGNCCQTPCFTDPNNSSRTICAPSCSGYNLDQCFYNFCPNVPGMCSVNDEPLISNSCDCVRECGDGVCAYDNDASSSLYNKCVSVDYPDEKCDLDRKNIDLSRTFTFAQGFVGDLTCRPYEGFDPLYKGKMLWHATGELGANCASVADDFFGSVSSWQKLPDSVSVNTCVDVNNECSVCENGLSCVDDGDGDYEGACGINVQVCGDGFYCNSDELCEQEDTPGSCECCCDENQNYPDGSGNPSCCAPLVCNGECGGEDNFGLCTGCANTNNPDLACGCEGHYGQFCDDNTNPDGVCRDCTVLTTAESCSEHSDVCCFDADSGSCKGIGDLENTENNGISYCSYYECSPTNQCNNTVITSQSTKYSNLEVCDELCVISDDEPTTCSGAGFFECTGVDQCPNSPGVCSTGLITEAGRCGTAYCAELYSQCLDIDNNNQCVYSENKCKASSGLQETCFVNNGFELPGNPDMTEVDINKVVCRQFGNDPGYKYGVPKIGTRCPSSPDWVPVVGGFCILLNGNQGVSCDVCDDGFECIDDGDGDNVGECLAGSGNGVCVDGSTCDNDVCVYDDALRECECCCRKDNAEQDCCSYLDPSSGSYVSLECSGSCGDPTDSNMGRCSGCMGAPDGQRDAACNCSGSTGKFCYDDGASGICTDCESLTTPEACSNTTTCCFDSQNNACQNAEGREMYDDGDDIKYCARYECNKFNPFSPNCVEGKIGTYVSQEDCNNNCEADGVPLGGECVDANGCNTEVCVGGLNCYNQTAGADCGYCCCEIGPNDNCGEINPNLSCMQSPDDTDTCYDASGNFGVCCGCSADSECDNVDSMGCGNDTCCHARPNILQDSREPFGSNICPTAKISAVFDTKMDISSFAQNVLVVGEYGDNEQCPSGTTVIASNFGDDGLLNKIYNKIARFFRKTVAIIFGGNAVAVIDSDSKLYCSVPGSVSGTHIPDGDSFQTKMEFSIAHRLDSGRIYYVIIQGYDVPDSNVGVKSEYGIGMNGGNDIIIGDRTFYKSVSWYFTVMEDNGQFNDKCTIDHVTIEPVDYLFKTNINDRNDDSPGDNFDSINDSDKLYVATARNSNGQALTSVDGVYGFNWSWGNGHSGIAELGGADSDSERVLRINDNVVNGSAVVSVTATDDEGTEFKAETNFNVFKCNNPWPPVNPDGSWSPWTDSSGNCDGNGSCPGTEFQLYYCMDQGGAGLYDDLPALKKNAVINATRDGIYKEFFFLRENPKELGAGWTMAESLSDGGGVRLGWESTDGMDGDDYYRVYYSLSDGNFTNYATVPGNVEFVELGKGTSYSDIKFNNNQIYYFAIEAFFSDSGVSTELSGSESVLITDSEGPTAPSIVSVERIGDTAIVEWTNNAGDDAVLHRVFKRPLMNPDFCNPNINFREDGQVISNSPVTILGVDSSFGYCIGVVAYDSEGNSSLGTGGVQWLAQ